MIDIQTVVGVIFRALAVFLLLGFVLPKSFSETKVSNGLGKMRRGIFYSLLVYSLSQIVLLFINEFRLLGLAEDSIIGFASMFNSISTLFLTFALVILYSAKYGREVQKRR